MVDLEPVASFRQAEETDASHFLNKSLCPFGNDSPDPYRFSQAFGI